jgi:large subunit ribosomal protein L17
MHHGVFGKKLSRTKNERRRLFANLTRDLILHGRIVTSRAKAKAIQPLVEKLVTKAKKGSDANRRKILEVIPHGDIVNLLMKDAKDRFSNRSSGFTRIVKIGNIRSDGSEEVMLSFVDEAIMREPVTYSQAKETKKVSVKPENKEIQKKVKKPGKKTIKSKKE